MLLILFSFSLGIGAGAHAQSATGPETPWPYTVKAGDATLTVYQPQLDSWDGYRLMARVAVAAARGQPPRSQYGIVTVEASTHTDKGTRMVTIDQAKIVQSEFPSATSSQASAWSSAIARELTGKSRTIALDRLEASLGALEKQRSFEHKPLRNAAPQFIFSTVPAILISIDGEPIYKPVSGTALERVINTRPLLLRDRDGAHYLKVFDGWMMAPSIDASWSVLSIPSADLRTAFKQASDAHLIDPLTGQTTADSPAPSLKNGAPAIHVTSVPAELIVTDGEPRYVPIAGTTLLYVENTTGNVFKDATDNKTYVLASGRWFRAAEGGGPWEYVAANALPADFARIPDDSAKENVKASVAGTAQAREAAIAASVPQTAAVKIADARLAQPRFDGDPVFKPIAGTPLQYVVNTATPIIRVDGGSFYAVQNGVWFTARSVNGPWAVATSVPAVIYSIPPESPLHYVTFVQINSVSNGVVYVGYTPGYQGTVVDPVTGVVVYGTGYVYDPWIGTVWYGAPVTYGYGATVAYTPWNGWAVGFGFGWAWGATTAAAGWGWGPYPYWGPWAYPAWGGAYAYGPAGGAAAWGPGGWAGYTGNIYTQWGNRATVSRSAGGYNAWTGNAWSTQVGSSYNSRTGVSSAGQRGAVQNVYTGNFAAGGRGVATGPGGNVAAGERGVVGSPSTGQYAAGERGAVTNPNTGQTISGGRGVAGNVNTGQATTYGRATGQEGGTVAHVGDDVYAGKDGNVYRNTGSGWEQHTTNGWQPTEGGAGATSAAGGATARSEHMQQLDGERNARQFGGERAQNLNRSSMGMQRSFGGGHMGGGRRR
ncbi:autotransporter [Noviherbaspirillum cavernae]|uniref:autotransporter n=1 Tax=Noviherbaspirillum cavernae TaxID=2320862 RepID=UPI0018F6262D|nr:autotransporter [Noviherbaspirillum cavernae]